MKNLFLLIAIGLIILTGCSKEDAVVPIEEQGINSIYVLNQLDETITWQPIQMNDNQERSGTSWSSTAQTNGYYESNNGDGITITWDGSQDGNVMSGSAKVLQITSNFNFHFEMETACVTVEGNEAVYGGRISRVLDALGLNVSIQPGWYFYFKVIDFNMVESVPVDLIANNIVFASPNQPLLCNIYSPTDAFWSSAGYTTMISPSFAQVNN